jgi:hypothetical protein
MPQTDRRVHEPIPLRFDRLAEHDRLRTLLTTEGNLTMANRRTQIVQLIRDGTERMARDAVVNEAMEPVFPANVDDFVIDEWVNFD